MYTLPRNYVRRILGVCLGLGAWFYGMSFKQIVILGIIGLIFLFVIVPSIFRWSTLVQRQMVFLPWVHWPKHVDFDKPENEGLSGARNFYISTDLKVEVGVWHILPQDLIEESEKKSEKEKKDWFETSLSNGPAPIVLYLHGNTGSRAREHRIELYKVLQKLNYHVICFDYRGYADSSPITPSKTGVVQDALKVYEYAKSLAKETPIIVYGHSLGTAVSTEAVAQLCEQGDPPKALILESPFNNIHDEIKNHPMSFLWRKMPWFKWFFTGTLTKNDVGFVSDQRIGQIYVPILIMHAKDDLVVPYMLGERLYQAALAKRPLDAKPVNFVSFESELGLAHIFIYSAAETPSIIEHFVSKSIDDNWSDDPTKKI